MKRLLSLLLVFLLLLFLACCDEKKAAVEKPSRAIDTLVYIGSQNNDFYYYYDKDTKVMYVVYIDIYKAGITPLYNADGTLKLYEGEDKNESDEILHNHN